MCSPQGIRLLYCLYAKHGIPPCFRSRSWCRACCRGPPRFGHPPARRGGLRCVRTCPGNSNLTPCGRCLGSSLCLRRPPLGGASQAAISSLASSTRKCDAVPAQPLAGSGSPGFAMDPSQDRAANRPRRQHKDLSIFQAAVTPFAHCFRRMATREGAPAAASRRRGAGKYARRKKKSSQNRFRSPDTPVSGLSRESCRRLIGLRSHPAGSPFAAFRRTDRARVRGNRCRGSRELRWDGWENPDSGGGGSRHD